MREKKLKERLKRSGQKGGGEKTKKGITESERIFKEELKSIRPKNSTKKSSKSSW